MRTRTFLLALVVCVAAGSALAAPIYVQNFEDSSAALEGWYADGAVWQPDGGVDNSGYLEGNRSSGYPWMGIVNEAGWNIAATFGNELSATVDIKWFNAGTGGPGIAWELWGMEQLPVASTVWEYSFGIEPYLDWHTYSGSINANWTDAEAEAAGWVRVGGSGSFNSVVTNNRYMLLASPVGGQPVSNVKVGMDNFVLVPEPATMALLAVGGIVSLIRKRK